MKRPSQAPAARPTFVRPMAAKLVDRLPEGADWLYEVKFDGYRALVIKDGADVRIRSRNDKDLTHVYPSVRDAARRIAANRATIDGEIVAVDAEGHPSFQALQHRSARAGHAIVFYAFDLLHLDGADLTPLALEARRHPLSTILQRSGLLFSEELHGTPDHIVAALRQIGLEGVVAKRRDCPYEPGQRTGAWVKLKLDKEEEFVIGGYRPGPHGIDALLVGFYEQRQLRFAGKVRAGFTPRVRREVFESIAPLHAERCPFVDLPNSKSAHWGGGVTAEQMREMRWLRPAMVARIRFVEWTAERHLRHAAFLGLRSDKA